MKRKDVKLYNLIFLLWMIWISTPQILLPVLVLNFIIDSAVVLITLKILKVKEIFNAWKKSILFVWVFGFLADIAASGVLFGLSLIADYNYYQLLYWIITSAGVLLAAGLIFVFNRFLSFKLTKLTKKQQTICAIVLAVFTAPYLFFFTTQMLYFFFF